MFHAFDSWQCIIPNYVFYCQYLFPLTALYFFNHYNFQLAIWRDSVRRRLVIAFRGTEQVVHILLVLLGIVLLLPSG